MTRKLYTFSVDLAEVMKSAQYIKVMSNSHAQLTSNLPATGEVTDGASINDESFAATFGEASLDIRAGDTFTIVDSVNATVFTILADVVAMLNVPATLTFSPPLDENITALGSITVFPVTRRGEAVERTVVMTYESNKE